MPFIHKKQILTVMKTLLIMIILLGGTGGRLLAQEYAGSARVTGRLTDSLTSAGVSYATVSLQQNDKQLRGMACDSAGGFVFTDVPYGQYTLLLSAVGYMPRRATLNINTPEVVIDPGVLILSQEIKNLKTVNVRGIRPAIEQRVDGITFNAQSLPIEAGANGADVLRKIPLLVVDPAGNIMMRGSSNIKVFIDGKHSEFFASSVADALKTIRGEQIVRVEVITNPSARYDAEGTDGVVNIITKKSQSNAASGNVTLVAANRSESVMTDLQAKYSKWHVNADLIYQWYWNRNGNVLDRASAGGPRLHQKSETRQSGDYMFGGASLLYSIDSLHTLSMGYRVRNLPEKTISVNDYEMTDPSGGTTFSTRHIITPRENAANSLTFGYNGTSADRRREFSILANYAMAATRLAYDLDQVREGVVDFRENLRGTTRGSDLTVQLDYSDNMRSGIKWESGGKILQRRLDVDSRFAVYDFEQAAYVDAPARGNDFFYSSTIGAVYANVSRKFSKWAISAGGRYEYTGLNATAERSGLKIPSFGNLVPQVLINRIISDKTSFKASFTTRLVRPQFSYLNPTINSSDSLTIQKGNPYLRPELTRRYQLSYTHSDPRWFKDVSLFFNDNSNSIEIIRTAVAGGLFESTWKNMGTNRRLGGSVSSTWKPDSKLSLGLTLAGQYVWLRSAALELARNGLMHQIVVSGSYRFPNGFGVEFYGFFDNKHIRLQGYREGWKYYSVTLRKNGKNDRVNLSMRFDAFLTPYTFITEETFAASYHQKQVARYQNQNIRLSVSFKLGKREIKTPKMRSVEAAE